MSKASFLFFFFTLTFDFFSNNSRICVSKRNNILVICMKCFQTLNRKQILVRRKRTWLCVRRGIRKREKEGRRERGREGGRKEGRKIKEERLWAVERNGREMPWSLERKDWESTRDRHSPTSQRRPRTASFTAYSRTFIFERNFPDQRSFSRPGLKS